MLKKIIFKNKAANLISVFYQEILFRYNSPKKIATLKRKLEEAREKLMQGVDLVADTVVGTLGPKAKTVVIKQNGRPVVINDGVTIAKAVFSDDPFIQMGVELVQGSDLAIIINCPTHAWRTNSKEMVKFKNWETFNKWVD